MYYYRGNLSNKILLLYNWFNRWLPLRFQLKISFVKSMIQVDSTSLNNLLTLNLPMFLCTLLSQWWVVMNRESFILNQSKSKNGCSSDDWNNMITMRTSLMEGFLITNRQPTHIRSSLFRQPNARSPHPLSSFILLSNTNGLTPPKIHGNTYFSVALLGTKYFSKRTVVCSPVEAISPPACSKMRVSGE